MPQVQSNVCGATEHDDAYSVDFLRVCLFQEEAYLKRVGELDYITDLRDKQKKNHEDLRKQRLDEFMKVRQFWTAYSYPPSNKKKLTTGIACVFNLYGTALQ